MSETLRALTNTYNTQCAQPPTFFLLISSFLLLCLFLLFSTLCVSYLWKNKKIAFFLSLVFFFFFLRSLIFFFISFCSKELCQLLHGIAVKERELLKVFRNNIGSTIGQQSKLLGFQKKKINHILFCFLSLSLSLHFLSFSQEIVFFSVCCHLEYILYIFFLD